MEENSTHDDIFKQKLEGYESSVPDDMFDRIMSQRDMPDASDEIIKNKLSGITSTISTDLFEQLMNKRNHLNTSTDDAIKARLEHYEAPVANNMFERIMEARDIPNPSETDSIIREKLLSHESEVPETLFEQIIATRDIQAATKASHFKKWALAALVLLLLGGTLAYILNTPSKTNTESSNEVNHNAPTSSNGSISSEGGIGNIAQSTVSKSTTNDYDAIQSNISVTPSNAANIESSNSTHGFNNDKNTLNSDLNKDINNGNTITGQKAETYKSIMSKKSAKRLTTDSKTASNTTIITSNSTPQQINNPTVSTSPVIIPSSNNDENKNSSISTKETLDHNNAISNEKEGHTSSYSPLSSLYTINDKTLALKELSHDALLKALPCPDPGCPTFGKKKLTQLIWYVDGYIAPEYAARQLTATSAEHNDYLTVRDSVEKSFYAFSSGIRATAILPNRFLLRGGINYTQNNEKFQKDSFGIGYIEYRTRLNTNTGKLDTISIDIISGFFRKTRHNSYRSYDFTIQAGYEYPLTERLTIGINAGANFNIKTPIKATILNRDLQPLVVSQTQTIYNTSIGTSLIGSIAAYWQIHDNWQILAEPQVRYYLNPITLNEYVLRQKYMNIGLNIGARYRF